MKFFKELIRRIFRRKKKSDPSIYPMF